MSPEQGVNHAIGIHRLKSLARDVQDARVPRRPWNAESGTERIRTSDPCLSDDSAALTGMKDRDVTLDAGFSITIGNAWGIASLNIVGDALGIHKGYEVSASYQYTIQLKSWIIVPSIGVNLPSAELVDYYGVRAAEAATGRPSYSGKSVVNTSIAVNVMYKIADHWQVIGGAEYVRLGDGITDSPIIERNHEATVFSALMYRF